VQSGECILIRFNSYALVHAETRAFNERPPHGEFFSQGELKVVRENLYSSREKAREVARDEFASLWFTNDHKEAEAAFAQKRQPVYTNS
jgi:hypothetical protein